MKIAPARLSPVFVPRLWGSHSLAPLFSDNNGQPTGLASGESARASPQPIGEVWLTGNSSVFATGPLAGRELGEAWPQLPPAWTGNKLLGAPRIPLLVKFIFPEGKLSVQVHPDDEYARLHEPGSGGVGKTELWYVVAAREGSELCLGLKQGVTPEKFQAAIDNGSTEECLRRFGVRAGDAFFVPAGTPHTIGPGMVLCEVQEHSDLTYRIFDYNRVESDGSPRPLHIKQALEVINFAIHRESRIDPVEAKHGSLLQTYLAACRYFAIERWAFSAPVPAATSADRFELLIVISGAGRIEWESESVAYDRAQVWLLPAALGPYRLAPDAPTTLLRTYLPDLQDFGRQLNEQQIPESVWSRVLHS